jgi:hypothetical protein
MLTNPCVLRNLDKRGTRALTVCVYGERTERRAATERTALMAGDEELLEGADPLEGALRAAVRRPARESRRIAGAVVTLLAGTEIAWLVVIGYFIWRLLT